MSTKSWWAIVARAKNDIYFTIEFSDVNNNEDNDVSFLSPSSPHVTICLFLKSSVMKQCRYHDVFRDKIVIVE